MIYRNPDGKFKRSYRKWASMLQRCYNPKHPAYPYYEGLGVCDRWRGKDGYLSFITDMGEPPPGLTLERKDNLKGYAPENCRWATWKEQAANRRRGGPPIDPNSLAQKAKAAGLKPHAVWQRIHLQGWTEERALSTPPLKRGRQAGWRKKQTPENSSAQIPNDSQRVESTGLTASQILPHTS